MRRERIGPAHTLANILNRDPLGPGEHAGWIMEGYARDGRKPLTLVQFHTAYPEVIQQFEKMLGELNISSHTGALRGRRLKHYMDTHQQTEDAARRLVEDEITGEGHQKLFLIHKNDFDRIRLKLGMVNGHHGHPGH